MSGGYTWPDDLNSHEKAWEIESREFGLKSLAAYGVPDSEQNAIALYIDAGRDDTFSHPTFKQHAVPVVQFGVAPSSRAHLCSDDV